MTAAWWVFAGASYLLLVVLVLSVVHGGRRAPEDNARGPRDRWGVLLLVVLLATVLALAGAALGAWLDLGVL